MPSRSRALHPHSLKRVLLVATEALAGTGSRSLHRLSVRCCIIAALRPSRACLGPPTLETFPNEGFSTEAAATFQKLD